MAWLETLPHWPDGTAAWLVTHGEVSFERLAEATAHEPLAGPDPAQPPVLWPNAIPVSTALRTGPRSVLLALGRRRGSLARLRDDPRVALAVIGPGVAFTARGLAAVTADPLPYAERVAAVTIAVARIQDHAQPTFAIDDGPRWHWTDEDARQADVATRAALRTLAQRA
ncbi:MAG: hypothetical protein MSC31_09900 [Solirubrobacteraceae bacterium MAG38_C4-C5]|nr:hypothetical protein [Candidatus Siliceabacter maunaloa]